MAIANTGRFMQPTGGSPFYNPGNQMPGYNGSPLYDWMAELEQRGYYSNWLGNQGLLGNDMNSDLARGLENKMQQGYQAELFNDPDRKWQDYLNERTGKVKDITASMDPLSRGINTRQYAGGARWLPRSR